MTNPTIKYYACKKIKEYIVNDKLHRDPLEGPAVTIYYNEGIKAFEKYIVNDKLHNPYGPAFISYYKNGNKELEKYKLNGHWHRDPLEGPAFIKYSYNGEVRVKDYWVNNKLHNPYGPAWIHYEYDETEWWINDIECTNEVNEYLDKYNLIWGNMTYTDFNIMWMNIL